MTHLRQVYVQPGEIHWSREPCVFRTVLGSCISVCLWDQELRIGGLTHFVLPRGGGAGDTRFGDIAVPLLTRKLRDLGCIHLVAKVFGGAAVLPAGETATVGDGNTAVALSLLHKEGISILAQRTGGVHGIVIHFLVADGAVQVREIKESLPF